MMYVRVETDEFLRDRLADIYVNPLAVDEIHPHLTQQGVPMDDRCELRMRDGRIHVAEGSPTAMQAWWWQFARQLMRGGQPNSGE